jgi:hypothetical protein
MIATSQAAPAAGVAASTAYVNDIVVFVGTEYEWGLEYRGRVLDFEFMPTFPAIRGAIMSRLFSKNECLPSIIFQ